MKYPRVEKSLKAYYWANESSTRMPYTFTILQVMSMKSSCESRKGRETSANNKNAIMTIAVSSF